MQDGNSDALCLLSGDKGSGKSSLGILLIKEYLHKFSNICPHCGNIFYRNYYEMEKTPKGFRFFIPEDIKNDKVWIRCPEHYELNLQTGVKEKKSGCGKLFLWSNRRRVKWNPQKFIAYNNSQAFDLMLKSPPGTPMLFDEAINFMSSLDFNKSESKELKRLFAVVRPKNYFMLGNVPEFKWIDRRYREDMSQYWLFLYERGECAIFEKNKFVSDDKYGLKKLEKVINHVGYFTPTEKVKKLLKKHPHYFDSFSFGEVDEKTYSEYEYYRNAANLQQQVRELELSPRDIGKVMAWNMINNWDVLVLESKQSKNKTLTHNILLSHCLIDPVTKKKLISIETLRNWIRGVDGYIKTKGEDVNVFNDTDKSII